MKSLWVVQVVIVGFDSGWLHEIRKLNGPSNYFLTDNWYKLKPCSQSRRRNKHLVNLVFHAIALLINCHESSPPRNQATLGKAQVYSSLIITKLPMLQLFVEWPNFCQWQANKLEMKGCAHIMLHLHTTFMFQWLRYTPNICTTCHEVTGIDSIALSWTWQQAPSRGIIIVMTFKRFYERKTDRHLGYLIFIQHTNLFRSEKHAQFQLHLSPSTLNINISLRYKFHESPFPKPVHTSLHTMNIAGPFHFGCEIELRICVLHIVEPSKHCPNLRRFSLVFPHSMVCYMDCYSQTTSSTKCTALSTSAGPRVLKQSSSYVTHVTHTNLPLTSRCIYTINRSTSSNDSANVIKKTLWSSLGSTIPWEIAHWSNANPQCHVLLCTLGAFGLRPGVEWQVPQPTETGKLPVQLQELHLGIPAFLSQLPGNTNKKTQMKKTETPEALFVKTPHLVVGVCMVALSLQWFSLHLNCPVASPTWISPHGKGKGELQSSGPATIPQVQRDGWWIHETTESPTQSAAGRGSPCWYSRRTFASKLAVGNLKQSCLGKKMQELTSKNTSNRRYNSTGFRLHMAVAEIRSGEWISSEV